MGYGMGIVIGIGFVVGLIALMMGMVHAAAAPALDDAAKRVRWRAMAVTVLCFIVVIGFALLSPIPAENDVRFATLPAVAGIVGVIAAGWSESIWRRPAGPVRVASLTIREELSGTGVGGLWRRYLAGLVVSLVLILVGGLTAAGDSRSVGRVWNLGTTTASPYPGWRYGLPIGVALVGLALATGWALRRVESRPALDVDRRDLDQAVRAGSRVRVLRFAAGGSVLTAAGLAATAGSCLNRLAQNLRMGQPGAPAGHAPWDWTQNFGLALTGAGMLALFIAFQALTWDAPRIPHSAGAASHGLLNPEVQP